MSEDGRRQADGRGESGERQTPPRFRLDRRTIGAFLVALVLNYIVVSLISSAARRGTGSRRDARPAQAYAAASLTEPSDEVPAAEVARPRQALRKALASATSGDRLSFANVREVPQDPSVKHGGHSAERVRRC